ncbi:16304_t:CDS:2 [Acaulospora colombiana]|uniref:16304_t:CDS:1 n=1 Tax=Acaulospora colombiana TaxID=27376 RepID=A0ACA9K6M0_9GLOM|nr:16304_t:CDS:2 [Acaulospora colombiana]
MSELLKTLISECELDEIFIEESKKKWIGRGGFGYVYKCDIGEHWNVVALKELRIDGTSTTIRDILNELKLHSRAKNNRIVELFGISRSNYDEDLCYLVMELADCDLREYLRNKKDELRWEEKIKLAIQITEGISYIHNEMKVAHRDLHTKNILVKCGNIKIADFGLSKNLNSITSSKGSIIGVMPYIDPKKLENNHYTLNPKSDIYSLGVIFWEISSCYPPFDKSDLALIYSRIIKNERENPIIGTPLPFVRLYSKCWDADPFLRPTADETLSQLQSLSFEQVYDGSNYINNYINGLDSTSTDFSADVVSCSLSVSNLPFSNIDNHIKVMKVIVNGKRPKPFSEDTPEKYKILVKEAWHNDPGKRPTIEEIQKKLEDIKTEVNPNRPSLEINEVISLHDEGRYEEAFPQFLQHAENRALHFLKKSADSNNVIGQYMFAYACLKGSYYDKNVGLKYLKKAALQGKFPDALYMVSQIFLNGEYGYPVDSNKYMEYLSKAATAGSKEAQHELDVIN